MNIEKMLEVIRTEAVKDSFVKWNGSNLEEVLCLSGALWTWNKLKVKDDGTLNIPTKDGGFYEVPKGSWLVKTPDCEVLPCGKDVRFVSNEMKKILDDLQERLTGLRYLPITRHEEEKPITTFIPEDPFETEVVDEGNAISLRRKLDKDGNPILKKRYSMAVDPAHGKDWSSYRVYESESDKSNWMKNFKNEIDKWKK